MAWFTLCLIYLLGIVAWPVAKLLEFVLGPHHGIIYRRAELKELIALHSSHSAHGGDLKTDTVTIIGATLDLQEKVVRQAMTPIEEVFMLSIDAHLDYDLLKKICQTGHSRVPVFEEVDVPLPEDNTQPEPDGVGRGRARTQRVKKIIGILLVKQCLLLDPKDAVPLRMLPLNKVPFVPQNEPLLGILDKFQEGRSHMAIVSRFSIEKAASVKKAVKRGLTQRLRERVGMGDSSDSSDSDEERKLAHDKKQRRKRKRKIKDIEEGSEDSTEDSSPKDEVGPRRQLSPVIERDFELEKKQVKIEIPNDKEPKSRRPSFQLPRAAAISALEQSMPADAVLTKEGAEEFLQGFDPAVHPLGIITLEDVLEELIGEEIYDEFDAQGAHGDPLPSASGLEVGLFPTNSTDATLTPAITKPSPVLKPLALKGLGFLRSRSAPPTPRDANKSMAANLPKGEGDVQETAEVMAVVEGPPANISRSNSQKNISGMVEVVVPPPETPSPKLPPATTPTNSQFVPHLTVSSTPVSRSVSPAPSLEAILLDRKRRQVGGGPTTTPSSSTLPVPQIRSAASTTTKGRFKSSPLVVADPSIPQPKGSNDESRIPDGKDKVGPDKIEGSNEDS